MAPGKENTKWTQTSGIIIKENSAAQMGLNGLFIHIHVYI